MPSAAQVRSRNWVPDPRPQTLNPERKSQSQVLRRALGGQPEFEDCGGSRCAAAPAISCLQLPRCAQETDLGADSTIPRPDSEHRTVLAALCAAGTCNIACLRLPRCHLETNLVADGASSARILSTRLSWQPLCSHTCSHYAFSCSDAVLDACTALLLQTAASLQSICAQRCPVWVSTPGSCQRSC